MMANFENVYKLKENILYIHIYMYANFIVVYFYKLLIIENAIK